MIRFVPHLVYYETSLIFFLILSWEHWGWWNPPKNYCSRLKCRVCSISCNISIFIRILYGNPNPPFIFADSHAWRIFPNCQAPSWASTPGATTSFVP